MAVKIESRGFRVSEICEQVPAIDVDSEGLVRLTVAAVGSAVPVMSHYLGREDFDAIYAAMTEVRNRLDDEALTHEIERKTDERPRVIIDKSDDVWVWRSDHNAYVIAANGHEACERDGTLDDGSTLEWIEENWGPLTFPA